MRIVEAGEKRFAGALNNILRRGEVDTSKVEASVRSILEGVRRRGDRALIDYTRRFDGIDLRRKGSLEVGRAQIEEALNQIPRGDRQLLQKAARRIRAFHRRQLPKSWSIRERDGALLGQRATPLERVGIYVPGGKAAYPSTVFMNAIPARVAGVDEVVMVTPPDKEGFNPYVMATAAIAGVDTVFQVGGAQAVGALAYGTESIPRVDKIVGPGNIYVATAKRLVYGRVDIDMIAGPSEILIVNDGTGEAAWMAADLLSQAEHDELASSVLLTTSREMAREVSREVTRQLRGLSRRAIAKESIKRYGLIIVTGDLDEAAGIANSIAPEHLELFVRSPFRLLKRIRHAGAIFLGPYTPEALGDYMAGPNHTLPTGGTARFSSPLGVYDFIKYSSVLSFPPRGLSRLGESVVRFTELEGLEAHGQSVSLRMKGRKS
ncbi:MAG: histidinol dehydrogenase [Thermodesulfobacteriota bacterium]